MAEDLLILGQAADAPADKHELAPIFAAQGVANAAIAARLDVDVEVVSRWRKRLSPKGWPGWVTGSVLGVHGRFRRRW